jgi:pyridoxamine 5'-phosphate oxidase
MEKRELADIRRDYSLRELSKATVAPDPFVQFANWLDEYLASDPPEPNAFVLSTVGVDGAPSSRVVLLKGFDDRGFVFFTNYTSRKAAEIDHEKRVSMTFFWPELERQVHVAGVAGKTPREESESYFASRPAKSKVGAWASRQSAELADRSELERKFEEARAGFEGDEIPCPSFWGGYRVVPTRFEFWQGRRSRLHDRICYEPKDGEWTIFRLYP